MLLISIAKTGLYVRFFYELCFDVLAIGWKCDDYVGCSFFEYYGNKSEGDPYPTNKQGMDLMSENML
jgi:hypothetical protein